MAAKNFYKSEIGKLRLLGIKEFKNLSTNAKLHLDMANNKKSTEDFYCEFNDESIALEIPYRSCGVGTQIVFRLVFEIPGRTIEMVGTGKIIEVDLENPEKNPLVRAEMKLAQYDRGDWAEILSAQEERLDQTTKLFNSMKE